MSQMVATPEKRKRGRPPGAENKPKITTAQQFLEPLEKKRRGRPPGAKNKPKNNHAVALLGASAQILRPQETAETSIKKGRGRPKGSKNKPKSEDKEKIAEKIKKARVDQDPRKPDSSPAKVEQSCETTVEHPLLTAVRWMEKHMHQTEVQHYRGRASKLGVSIHAAMAADLLGFFNIQDPEINKLVRKNNFIVTSTNAIH